MKTERRSTVLLVVICVASFALMVGSSLRDSAVVDELAHIPAGYAYLHYSDYRLNPEHPPLVKALAALPLQAMHLKFPEDNPFWTTAVNGEWGVGGAFLYGLKNDAYAIIQWARLFPMLLTIALILFSYGWTRRLFGPSWALLPAVLVGLSPIILAQGHYVTTDVAAALGVMLGLFTFVNFVKAPTRAHLFIAGIGYGAAALMKFSTVILIPVYLVLFFIYWLATKQQNFWRWLGSFFLIIIIGYFLIVYPVYSAFTANYPPDRQLSDTATTLSNLTSHDCGPSHPVICAAKLTVWGAEHSLTRPFAEYSLGVLIDFERSEGANLSYFWGNVYVNGSHWYFPVVYGIKESLPVLVILLVAFLFAIAKMLRGPKRRSSIFRAYVVSHFPQFSMLVFVLVYFAWSMESRLNIGVRHLLPVIPLLYILAASALRRLPASGWRNAFVGVMLAWLGAETLFAYPHYLSYMNELGGGVQNGYRYVVDSNYDWGQDMFALTDFANAHPEISKLALDFFGASNPEYYLGDRYVPWKSSMGDPSAQNIHWFAVSITDLQNAIQPPATGYVPNPADTYSWLVAKRGKEAGMGGVPAPDYRVGTSIFIYKI